MINNFKQPCSVTKRSLLTLTVQLYAVKKIFDKKIENNPTAKKLNILVLQFQLINSKNAYHVSSGNNQSKYNKHQYIKVKLKFILALKIICQLLRLKIVLYSKFNNLPVLQWITLELLKQFQSKINIEVSCIFTFSFPYK